MTCPFLPSRARLPENHSRETRIYLCLHHAQAIHDLGYVHAIRGFPYFQGARCAVCTSPR